MRMCIPTFLILLFGWSVAPAADGAGKGEMKDQAFPAIGHHDLVTAIEAGKVTVIDVNGSESYQKAHVTGAIDYLAVKDDFASHLPADKDALLVAYCGGPACKAYRKAAKHAKKLGYSNIKHYPAGIVGWLTADDKPDEGEAQKEQGDHGHKDRDHGKHKDKHGHKDKHNKHAEHGHKHKDEAQKHAEKHKHKAKEHAEEQD